MKLKIDTGSKVIQLEQSAKLTELFALVRKLFPDNEWKQYSIEAVTYIYNWQNPIYIPSVWDTNIYPVPYTLTTTGESETFCIESN